MPAVIAKFDSRAAKFFVSASFILATIGNQIAADTYPFSNVSIHQSSEPVVSMLTKPLQDITGMSPKYINIFRATVFVAIFCVVSTPWNIIKNAAGLLAFLSGYSCFMGPLAGVMICDYYLIKKCKLDVDELYADRGIYWYNGGWNWRAYVSFIIGFAPLMPGFAKSIDHSLDIGGAWKIYSFAWTFGFFTSVFVHYILCTYISVPTKSLVEIAVYPPHLGDEAPSIIEGEDAASKSTQVTAKEKEAAGMV
jgi:cytosine/uracil/thiamine/allantoin permease